MPFDMPHTRAGHENANRWLGQVLLYHSFACLPACFRWFAFSGSKTLTYKAVKETNTGEIYKVCILIGVIYLSLKKHGMYFLTLTRTWPQGWHKTFQFIAFSQMKIWVTPCRRHASLRRKYRQEVRLARYREASSAWLLWSEVHVESFQRGTALLAHFSLNRILHLSHPWGVASSIELLIHAFSLSLLYALTLDFCGCLKLAENCDEVCIGSD